MQGNTDKLVSEERYTLFHNITNTQRGEKVRLSCLQNTKLNSATENHKVINQLHYTKRRKMIYHKNIQTENIEVRNK